MSTDNPKISLYVPPEIYERFREFQKEKKLSMSQAGIVILAEYFGIEKSTDSNRAGGVTLAEFKKLKEKVESIERLINEGREGVDQKETTSSSPEKIKAVAASELSQERFRMSKSALSSYKRKHSSSELVAWTKEKDPDGIGWIYNSELRGYVPSADTSEELKIKAQSWIKQRGR